MVKRFFSAMGREIRGLHEAAYVLASFAFLSQILALFRDKLLAFTFGAGHQLDIYYAAFRVPDFIFALIGSLVSASILLPFFIDSFSRSQEEGKGFSDSIFTVFFLIIIFVSALIFIFAQWLVPVVLPGFARDPALPQLILAMRIMLLSPIFLAMSNLFSSLTQMRHRFLVYAASPVMYNLGIIVGVVFLHKWIGISGLAIGVALGAFLHMAIQVPFLLQEKLLPVFTNKLQWSKMKHIILVAFPRTITLSANELAEFIFISMASLLTAGSISVFNLAFNLQSVPLALIGVSYSSAVFPTLSRLYYEKNTDAFLQKMITAARHIIFWSMPITILFIVLRAQIVRTVLGAGKFDWADTRMTAAMLALFIISTVGQSLIVLFVRAFYAEGKTARPLLINIISATTIILLGFGLVWTFDHVPVFQYFIEDLLRVSGQNGANALMLALAYSIGVVLNTILHWVAFEKSYKGFSKPVLETFFHSFSASVIAGTIAFMGLRIFAVVFPLERVWGIFMQGLCSGVLGLTVGVLVLILLNNAELQEVWKTLHQKIWKAKVPPAEVERL
jgi:putative peptidoglycan lipid II flippase